MESKKKKKKKEIDSSSTQLKVSQAWAAERRGERCVDVTDEEALDSTWTAAAVVVVVVGGA